MNKVRVTTDALGVEFEPPLPDKVTKQEAEFMITLEKLALRVSSSFRDTAQIRRLLDKIVAITNNRIDQLSTSLSFNQLLQLIEFPIVDEARKVQQLYLNEFKRYATQVSAISALLILGWALLSYNLRNLYTYAGPLGSSFIGTAVSIVGSIGFTGVGLVLGFGLNFYLISNNKVTIDNFDQTQHWSVRSDFFYLYIITAIVLILLYFQILALGILTLNLNQIEGQPWLGLLVGILCGFSESRIADKLKQVFRPTASKAPVGSY